MVDQVDSLKKMGIGFCDYINSDLPFIEREIIIERVKSGEISILYLSPELLLSYDIRAFIGERKLGLLVIDEAHLVTTWGRDFRVDYWYLGNYLKKMRKYTDYSFCVFALTATAVYSGKNDTVFDTIDSLNLELPVIRLGDVKREDIIFKIRAFSYTGNHELKKIDKTKEVIMGYLDSNEKALV